MEAIVLQRRDLRENDVSVSLLTRDAGRLELVARGAKKITSKNAAHLLPFSYISATVEPGRATAYLTRAQPVEFFSSIRTSLPKSLLAGFAVWFTHRMTQTHNPDAGLFVLLRDWLFFS